MKTPTTLFALWSLTFTALAIDTSPDALKEKLLGLEGPGELTSVVQEIEGLPEEQRKASLKTLVQIVRDDLKATTQASGLVSKVAFVLKATRDESSLIGAFAAGLGQMNPSDQIDASDALSVCTSKEAADAIATATRSRLSQVRPPSTTQTTEDERRALNDAAGGFVQLMKRLAKTAEPNGKKLAADIRAELVAKSSGAPVWNLLLQAVDAEIELHTPLNGSTSNSTGNEIATPTPTKTATSKTLETKPAPTPSEESTSSTPWLVWAVLIVAATGLLWLLLKNRN